MDLIKNGDKTESELKSLHENYDIPGQVWFEINQHGMLQAQLKNEHGNCRISLYGGQVLDCHLKVGGTLLWLSSKAIYKPGTAIRGGIPLVFPWFGSHPTDATLPAHGFARLSRWKVASTSANSLTLGLTDDETTRNDWPHSFRAQLTIRLDCQGLGLELEVFNTGNQPWSWTGGFHPYFHVGDLASTKVRGLDPGRYMDLLDGQKKQHNGPIEFGDPLDRIYLGAPNEVIIDDPTQHREIVISQQGADGVIVWNPGSGHPKSDMPATGPDQFICVEPARVSEPETLGPGQSRRLSMGVHIRQRVR